MRLNSIALVAGAASFFAFAETTDASTFATGFIDGAYSITTTEPDGPSVLFVEGSFEGSIDPEFVPPTGDVTLTLDVGLALGDVPDMDEEPVLSPVVFESISGVVTEEEFFEAVFLGFLLISEIAAIEDELIELPDVGVSVLFDVTSFMASEADLTASGEYELTITTEDPIGPLADDLLDVLLEISGLDVPALDAFAFPSEDEGIFAITASASISAVPVPAGGLLLLTGLAGLGAVRRRKLN